MTIPDLVALSLLPAARRRAGAALAALPQDAFDAADVLELLVAYCSPGEPDPDRRAAALREQAKAALERGRQAGLSAVGFRHSGYPPALGTIPGAPPVLWTAGRPATLAAPAVAIVGSRAASPSGLEMAERLGRELAAAGLTIVSGMARGCDAAAHRGALDARGWTLAVLGCGADVVYPPEHRRLYSDILDAGAIVSELPPGAPPLAGHFPLRNRIISGLARAVIVVEASDRSGSLITAGCALEQGRDVMAVPGSALGSRYRGCHGLLRDGARLVTTAEDVLQELGLTSATASRGRPNEGDPLLALLAEDSDVDTLADRSGLPPGVLLARLLELELAGRVRRRPGGRFVRAGG